MHPVLALLETTKRTYGTAYVITILPKLIRSLILLIQKPNLNSILQIKNLLLRHFKAPLPRFILILFGGYQVLELLFRRWKRKYSALIASFTSSLLAFTMIPDIQKADVSLTAFVRAVDVFALRFKFPKFIHTHGSTIAFQLATWQIMYAWFYYPSSLPKLYNKWILRMAHMDSRLLDQLNFIRHGKTVYQIGIPVRKEIQEYVKELGFPKQDIMMAPIPCYYAHGGMEGCMNHTQQIFINGLKDGLKIYGPLNIITFLFRWKSVKKSNLASRLQKMIGSMFQSSTFLASFIAIIWGTICVSRNSFNKLDGPSGVTLATFLCGFSILLERPDRRRQLALYCLPKAIESFCTIQIPAHLNPVANRYFQYALFSSSMSYLFTAFQQNRENVSPLIRSLFRFFLAT